MIVGCSMCVMLAEVGFGEGTAEHDSGCQGCGWTVCLSGVVDLISGCEFMGFGWVVMMEQGVRREAGDGRWGWRL